MAAAPDLLGLAGHHLDTAMSEPEYMRQRAKIHQPCPGCGLPLATDPEDDSIVHAATGNISCGLAAEAPLTVEDILR